MKPLLLLFALGTTLHAAEYFTARNGNDSAEGHSPQTAFATIAKGAELLQPGDTLTILPGTYFEAVTAKISGTPEKPITIRAQRPGTVLLRGDVDAPPFRPAQGQRRTYVADFKQRVEGIAERGWMKLYEPVSTIEEVEQTNATYYQDDDAGRVYVHTSDSAPADARALAFSVTNGFGILLLAPKGSPTVHDVVVDGLSFTGYQSREFPKEPGSRNRWGLAIINAEHVTVRHCTSYLNSGGIFLLMPIECLVEECHAYGNLSRFQPVGNNILGWGVTKTTFRRNVVEGFWPAGSSASDITFYGGGAKTEDAIGYMLENVAINAGIMTKGSSKNSVHKGNAAVGGIAYYYVPQDETNLLLKNFQSDQALRTYVDPLGHDFRRQADAPGGGAADVFFVSPGGDDAATGGSLKTAWRTLAHAGKAARPGDTVYITAGEYHDSLAPAQSGTAEKPIRFLRRGEDRAVIDGDGKIPVGVELTDRSHITVSGLLIRNCTKAGLAAQRGAALDLENLIITGIAGDAAAIAEVKDLTFSHNLLRDCRGAGLRLANCAAAIVTSNIFDACTGPRLQCDGPSFADLWSDTNDFPPAGGNGPLVSSQGLSYETLAQWQATRNDPASVAVAVGWRDNDPARGDFALGNDSPLIGRAVGGMAIGPFLRRHVNQPVPVQDLALHDAGSTSATLEWSTPAQPAETTLEWGEDASCPNKVSSPIGVFHTVSLIGLKPGARYFYRVTSPRPYSEVNFAPYTAAASNATASAAAQPHAFQTAGNPAAPRTLHVALTGNDNADGLSAATPVRTINRAADLARAGDTVLIHEGKYEETAVVRSTGTESAPITFRAAPGETVWMEGSNRFRATALRIADKHYITLDGLRFRHFRYAPDIAPVIRVTGGSHVTIRRCFHDGRESQGYVPGFIAAADSDHFLVDNTVMINGMGEGLSASRCPDITVQHCVFYNNFIRALTVNQFDPKLEAHLHHNLVCDSLPWKTYNALFRVFPFDVLRSDHNVFFTRVGIEERSIVETNSIHGKTVGYQLPGQYHGETLRLAEVQKTGQQEMNSHFGNPGIPIVATLVPSKTAPPVWQKAEMRWDGKTFGPLDFADFFIDANNPLAHSADGAPAGLDPKAFTASSR